MTRFSLPIRSVPPTDIAAAFPDEPRARILAEKFPVKTWRSSVRAWEVAENLYVLDLLDSLLPETTRLAARHALDVGSKNWTYLAAQRVAIPCPWVGVELDAYRRVGPLQTRASIAQWRLRSHSGCRYVVGSVEDLHEKFDLVVWMLPFVTRRPHHRWGLPNRFFHPEALLRHVWSLVADGGTMLVTNQSGDESLTQASLFIAAGIVVERMGPFESRVSPFRNVHNVWMATRPCVS